MKCSDSTSFLIAQAGGAKFTNKFQKKPRKPSLGIFPSSNGDYDTWSLLGPDAVLSTSCVSPHRTSLWASPSTPHDNCEGKHCCHSYLGVGGVVVGVGADPGAQPERLLSLPPCLEDRSTCPALEAFIAQGGEQSSGGQASSPGFSCGRWATAPTWHRS